MRKALRRYGIGLAAVAAVIGGCAAVAYHRDMAAAKKRVSGVASTIPTRSGVLEFVVAGEGPPLLMVHGTGGGFDQGLLFAEALRERGFRIVAPSRFGYLDSSFPADPSSERQADEFVTLLDHLGLDRVVVAGGSAGALSAAAFALRHPDRCAGLVLLVPAGNLSGKDPVEMSALQKRLVARLAASDFLYWTALQVARDQLVETLLATDPKLVQRATPGERHRVRRILEAMLPISRRTRGMLNDGYRAGAPVTFDFSAIAVPTLVISVEDDRFGTAATARKIAARVRGAQLKIYPSGGHIWLGHDEDVAGQMGKFIAGAYAPRR